MSRVSAARQVPEALARGYARLQWRHLRLHHGRIADVASGAAIEVIGSCRGGTW